MHGPLLFALPQMTREQEISLLEWRRSLIQQELDYVNKRLEELRK